ncbi:hypothetical protein M378DRAFT_9318 [Amanita muscaria Koide BX008]|uniref:Rho-GAP domain-containing protein n=1 Tax=Amanita muscaria (strain Koide BX008) TaxID=946122 RepID=A0A0C2SVU9_AMAMK|nr:hypothetical protein M378DRAFT_9318 [Amanita muscaria Koide BX008]
MPSVTHSSPRPPSSAHIDNFPNPPTKASLRAWWSQFTSNQKPRKDGDGQNDEHPVFGKPLSECLRYASVQISTSDSNGRLYVWGYIPVVVAKCGLYLKENATEVEGTFRVSGSNKRMRELQASFEATPRYGKDLDWKQESYTAHDVASVFRRYLNRMPEPVIPYSMYHSFRDSLAKERYNIEEVIKTYKSLIRQMPRPNQYLLLYVLDLLAVFARKSEKNLMTATNLAVMFQPGIISHPNHELSPHEHTLSQKVLEFLIDHQDWFMLDIPPPTQSERGSSRSSTPKFGHDLVLSKEQDDWCYIDKLPASPPKVTRRKTTMEHRTETDFIDAMFRLETQDKLTGRDLAPISESPLSDKSSSNVGVGRSQTLPPRSRAFTVSAIGIVANGNTSNAEKSRVLRKQKRAQQLPSERQGTTKEP